MSPLPQTPHRDTSGMAVPVPDDDDIVISGISGLLPDCASFNEFAEKIYEKKNLVTSNPRWKNVRHPELPEQCGRIPGLDNFDAQFFTVFYTLAQTTEPTARKMFGQTYQAIFDSGICPMELSGKKIGVYISAGLCETEKMCWDPDVSLAIVGCSRSMYANRISYWLNLKGPSITLDGACCGTLLALERARDAIMSGICEAAIVGSGKLVIHPQTPIMYNRTVCLNYDGKTKSFDEAADGQSMSEAINVIFLQKYKDAKRVCAILKHVKTQFCVASNDVDMVKFKVPRDVRVLSNFYREFYAEAGISPSSVGYVEGYGSATRDLDKLELDALDEVFCKDREDTLLVGSVASNVGYTETASASCGIFKIIAAYQRGMIAATINCENPRQDVAGLREGRMRIVTENTPFNNSYAAVNAFSFTGLTGHAVFQAYFKHKNHDLYKSEIPHLVAVSGRMESSVEKILNDIKSRPIDPEEIALVHNIHKSRISKHLARGFGVYSTKGNVTESHCSKVDYYDDAKRPLWFVYSGMGSQWVGMGCDLMKIPIFANAIQRCHEVLEPKGVDLISIITSKDKTTFNNILNSFVGIAAIQIGLTDILTAIGLVPDKVIGHSLGELGCAYVDGCFTVEEMMMLAYTRGYVSIQTPFIHGSMAAIGMGHKNIAKICPPEIVVACHNSPNSCTISGPAEDVQKFVDKLTKQGIFAKEVQCSNIPYHSRYIADAGPEFLRMSKEVVKEPKLRSSRWISSSVPEDKWNELNSIYSSAEYHTNNLLNTVLFEEALKFVPNNAVLVEIAPHGLLQAILNRAIPADCHSVSLTHRGHSDNAIYLLESIGKLYMDGCNPDISALYPKIEFPVSTETRPISHFVEWADADKWKICSYVNPNRIHCSVLRLLVSSEDDEFNYLTGHSIEGLQVFPFSAVLVAVWDAVAMTAGHRRREVSVQFSNIKLHSQPPLDPQGLLKLSIMVQRGSGRFEVFCDKGIIAEGVIVLTNKKGPFSYTDPPIKKDQVNEFLELNDVYQMLFENGYEYKDQFCGIQKINTIFTQADIKWLDNWATFIDAILQTYVLRDHRTGVVQPSYIMKLVIDVRTQINERLSSTTKGLLRASYDDINNRTRCGGVVVENVFYKSKLPSVSQAAALVAHKFLPFFRKESDDLTTSLYLLMQTLSEILNTNSIHIHYVNISNKLELFDKIKKYSAAPPKLDLNITLTNVDNLTTIKDMDKKPDVIFMHDLLSDKRVLEELYNIITPNTFLISVGIETDSMYSSSIYKPISAIGLGTSKVELARFRPNPTLSNTTAVTVRNNSDFQQLVKMQNELRPQHKLLVLSPHPAPSGLKDIVKEWNTDKNNVSLVMFDPKYSMDKALEHIPDVPYCVLQKGVWGSEFYVPSKSKKISTIEPVALRCLQPGNINSISWVQVPALEGPGINVTVHFAGLSARDSKRALGETLSISTNDGYGMDFSGVTDRGERVMGLLPGDAVCSKVRANSHLLWPVPSHWSLEDAATVPLAYAHAFYCLGIKFHLRKGMAILVHGGAGALGQAVISIALANGCRVFATVSDVRKKRFLKKLFPELEDGDIGNSRDSSYMDIIKMKAPYNELVGTRGCDLVINCLKGDLKHTSMQCCGLRGEMLDVTQLEDQEYFSLGLYNFQMEKTYRMVDLSSIFSQNSTMEMKKLQLLISEGISRGYVRPLSRVVYEPHETPRALRLLAASRHRGRVLISLEHSVPLVSPRVICNPDSGHVVVCDNDGFGLQIADALVKSGAKKLYIHGTSSPYTVQKIKCWQTQGVHVNLSKDNLATKENVMNWLKLCTTESSIEGIYINATHKENSKYMKSLVVCLDLASKKLCPHLKQFVVVSEEDKLWRDIILKRCFEGFPSLSFVIEKLKRYNLESKTESNKTSKDGISWQKAIEEMEKAMASGESVVISYLEPSSSLNIIEEVSKVPGVNITSSTVDRTTLEQVGIDYGRAHEVANLLQQKFNITLSKYVLPTMTIAQLKKLTKVNVDIEQDVEGFGAYISHFDPDEMQATSEMVVRPTLVHKTEMRADEFDMDHDYLCIIPGLEGHFKRFDTMCQRLKIPAAVLQLDHYNLSETIQDMAKARAEIIMQKLPPKRSFYLLGYEFGVLIALEIAAILESYGLVGTVYMLGGSPQDIKNSFNNRWKNETEDSLQNSLVTHMYSLITGNISIELEKEIETAGQWSDKVTIYEKALSKKVAHTTQYTIGLLEGLYARIKLLQSYEAKTYNLQSNIIILRANIPNIDRDDLKGFPKELKVHNLKSSLGYACQDLRCSNFINKYLGEDILDEFDNSNQCETALVNRDLYLKLKNIESD